MSEQEEPSHAPLNQLQAGLFYLGIVHSVFEEILNDTNKEAEIAVPDRTKVLRRQLGVVTKNAFNTGDILLHKLDHYTIADSFNRRILGLPEVIKMYSSVSEEGRLKIFDFISNVYNTELNEAGLSK
jgi:hypothetical protein